MLISSDIGDFNCNTLEEYRIALRKCLDTTIGYEIWCSEGQGTYPCIAILGNQSYSVVNYFAEEDGDIYASLGDIEQEGEMKFKTKTETYEIAAYQLISLKLAMKCADEFFCKLEMPACIEWEEL
ncbi:MAG: hypothetical protein HDT30_00845 [Clostridiales bacterium]|nr:hypothetical protein [Clostridiales bacterium]